MVWVSTMSTLVEVVVTVLVIASGVTVEVGVSMADWVSVIEVVNSQPVDAGVGTEVEAKAVEQKTSVVAEAA